MADLSNKPQGWEKQWREAFDKAEVPPSPHVWKNVESELTLRETGKYRRGFLFYRAIAAALLLLIAGLSWYIIAQQKDAPHSLSDAVPPSRSTPVPPTADERSQASPKSRQPMTEKPSDELTVPGSADHEKGNAAERSLATLPDGKGAPSSRAAEKATANASRPDAANLSPLILANPTIRESTAIDQARSSSGARSQSSQEVGTNVMLVAKIHSRPAAEPSFALPASLAKTEQLYRVPQALLAFKKDEKETRPSFFAGLAVAPGYFDPQFQTSAAVPESDFMLAGPSGAPGQDFGGNPLNTASAPSSSSGINDRPELSLTYGIDVGMKLSEHWVLASGIDYHRFSTSAETRWAVADIVTGNRYPYLAANSYTLNRTAANPAPTMNTLINNAYEFVSVPLQIGYQVAMSKLNFTLSSGVAANFFLGNNISAPASPLTDTRVSAEAGSPFKPLYYSGVLSGGVSYHLLDNYFLSLAPSYTFALTELTKQESVLSSQPHSFGINVGFQYLF